MPTVSFEDAWGARPKETLSFEEAQTLPAKAVNFMKGYTRAMLGQGAAMGFGDEIEAGARSVIPGQGGYSENLERIRGEIDQYGKDHPIISTGIELAGAALPAVATRGRSLPQSIPQAMGRGAATGAGYGAAYGFGTGEGEAERTAQAVIGGLIGGVLPAVAGGLVHAARPLGRMVRAAIAPTQEAERRVAQAIATDQASARPALPEPDMARAMQVTGQPVTNIERGGETTRALARSAANQSPQARDTLNQTIDARIEGQGDRITQFVQGLVGGGNAPATREALTEAARRANRPAYARAYQQGDRGLWSPELERLAGSPDVLAAMKAASTTGKSRAVNEGFGAFNSGVQITDDGRVLFQRGRQGVPTYPNLQFWDYAKRELADAANAARRAGRNEEAARLSGQASILRNELDRMVPSYRGAREGAAAYFGAQDALEAGQNFINRRVDWREAQNAVGRMAPAERQLFAEGFADALIRRVEQAGDRRNVVNQIFGSRDARTRMRIALGQRRYGEMEAFLRVEAAMDLVRNAVQGNSTTTRQLVELGLVGAGGAGYSLATGDPRQILLAVLYAGGRGAQMAANRNVSNRVADMLISNDPTVYLQGVRRVANNPRLMQRLRHVGAIGGSAGAQPATGLGSRERDEAE